MKNNRDITTDKVAQFLETLFHKEVLEVVPLSGGKHSQAFSYRVDTGEYVIRVNESSVGFEKDAFAHTHFSEYAPIPQVYEKGSYGENLYFCISEKVMGETIKNQYAHNNFNSFKQQFDMIEKIASIPIPAEFKGFGEWNPNQSYLYESIESYIKSMYQANWRVDWNKAKTREYYDQDFIDLLIKKIEPLIQYSENHRVLVHGDFGNDNCFIQDGRITGVIDWEKFCYADHFFDVGRIVLYCPSREAAVNAVFDYYEKSYHVCWLERMKLGFYITMLVNVGLGAQNDFDAFTHSPKRLEEFERLVEGKGK